jgi:serine/threonine protein kinase
MNKDEQKRIEQLAAKINDGDDSIVIDDGFESEDSEKLFLALKKINQVSQIIRRQAEFKGIKENQTWAHLKLKEKIGQGGIGEVYRAYDSVLDCDVAVKFLNRKSQLYVSKQQFLQEARNMAKVRHPHVLAIHGATIDDGVAGYWGDYLDGQTLNDYINQGSLSWQQQLKISKELASALMQIHKNTIVHGDIKPQNVMIQPYRGAILLDFGSSQKQQFKNNNKKIIQASPMAMAPEQFVGQHFTKASDVFSMGLLFWNLNTGHHPLSCNSIAEIQNQTNKLSLKSKQLKGNQDWQKLIRSMINPNPDLRPTIQQVVKILNGIEQKPIKRAKNTAIAALLILAIGITSISLYSNHKTKQANQETKALNNVLTDILMKSSPLEKGKDVLLIDILKEAEIALINNKQIFKKQKNNLLLQLIKTYKTHNDFAHAMQLTEQLLSDSTISNSLRLELSLQKAFILTNNKQHKESQKVILEALKLDTKAPRDISLKISAMTILIYAYNESEQLDKALDMITQANKLWQKSEKRSEVFAKLNLVEGFYYELREQPKKAYAYFQTAIENYRKYYKTDKNTDVLNARAAAAMVLTYEQETITQGIKELEIVVKDMEKFLGNANTTTLSTRMNLAINYAETEDYKKAIDTIVPYIADIEKIFGKKGAMTIAFKQEIIAIYLQNNNKTAAQKLKSEIKSE